MSKLVESSSSKKLDLDTCVVENHNEVVWYIHRAIASKTLPFSGITMVHFDSHPDLLLDPKLLADTVYKPNELYEQLSIENWLLPLVYAKHISTIVWVKPPWAQQISTSEQTFFIGKDNENGLFSPACEMSNCTEVKLVVLEITPSNWTTLSDESNLEKSNMLTQQTETSSISRIQKKITECVNDSAFILDIDLDFFSTANPFKALFTEQETKIVKDMYNNPILYGKDDKALSTYCRKREERITLLASIFHEMDTQLTSLQEINGTENVDPFRIPDDHLEYLTQQDSENIQKLWKTGLKNYKERKLTFRQLHDYGCTLDDTELPHHISSDKQVEALLNDVTGLLEALPKPKIVTISRSSEDDYCPKDKVEGYQTMVLDMIEGIYGPLSISLDYG